MDHAITGTPAETVLHGALELSKNSWLLALQLPDREQPSLYPIRGGDTDELMAKLTAARERCAKVTGKPTSIVLCYDIAAVMTREVYYRQFDNRRQVAGFLGLATSPHDSGDVERSQGISRAGRGQVRGIMIQAAWLWLKHQPKSAITRWFVQRTAGQSGVFDGSCLLRLRASWRSPCGASLSKAWCRKAPYSPTGNTKRVP
jgi:hypothetical protein